MKKNYGFTLAEVLITLTIIGVIAAITIPNLITSYQKHVVETKVVKFFSNINNAVKLSYIDNGSPEDWVNSMSCFKNQTACSYNDQKNFLEKYFLPYIKYQKITDCGAKDYNGTKAECVTLPEGSMFYIVIDYNGCDIVFFVNGKHEKNPKNTFAFQFTKRTVSHSDSVNSNNFVEPYIYNWNGNISYLKKGSNFSCYTAKTNTYDTNYCSKLLQLNHWKIPDDYPW